MMLSPEVLSSSKARMLCSSKEESRQQGSLGFSFFFVFFPDLTHRGKLLFQTLKKIAVPALRK